MAIKYRPMRPTDVAKCAALIAAHPVIGPRYGSAIADLPAAWLQLLRCQAKCASVFDAGVPGGSIRVVGVTVFVTDDFVREVKTPSAFWFGPELLKRVLRGNSPILSDRQFREANSRGGLNLLTWEGCVRPEFEKNTEIQQSIIINFIEEHRGFLLKEVIASQIESVERFQWTLQTGGMLWNPVTLRYEMPLTMDPEKIIRKPHVVGITREIELARGGSWSTSWVGTLFDYQPPQFGFSPGEQRLLLSALSGGTDVELSDDLGKSHSTVKNTWRSIYDRVDSCRPGLFSGPMRADAQNSDRGKEKRRHLLAYVREHPEELRAVSQKLLRNARNLPDRRPNSSR